ncbi:glycosyltransferase family 4 protein [Acetobacterium wieringae]|uniref:glycosyltransferase family 4 protein n=1 Tax=Acetobacterium wieringae TaxID=52694 RepID=UPI0020347994|nr:glycosyltransferase family 4 protein [Acetobacterium wieringae]URN84117.1 glycosyltransferase family 4 protein [Acetobacterium wieringae]
MKKIAILLPALLPVPAVRGGAVESIIENLVNENERNPIFRFTVYSAWDFEAVKKSQYYQYTDFVYIKTNEKIEKIHNYLYRVLKKLFKISITDRIVRKKLVKEIAKQNYDWILYEAGEVFCLKRFSKYLPSKKVLVHAHGMITPIPEIDSYFSYYLPISEFVADYWKSKSKRPLDTYLTWKNCIKIENFNRTLKKDEQYILRQKLGLDESDFVAIFIGRIIPEKGVLELIKSLNYISDNTVKIIVIGSAKFADCSATPYEKLVVEEVKKTAARVIFTGYVKNDELYKYYSVADIAVVPSTCEEAAGLVVVEAMAAGKPIITTGTGGIKEYTASESTYFVKNDERLERSLALEILRQRNERGNITSMGIVAQEKAKEFNMSNYLKRFEDIIKQIS